MTRYSIILPNERSKTYAYVTWFVLGMNLFLFASIYFGAVIINIKNVALTATFISLTGCIFLFLQQFNKSLSSFRVEIVFIILSTCWFLIDRYLLALCIFTFAIMGTYSKRAFEIIVSEEGIIYPSFPKKKFSWEEISNVILKDGILTIDLKNNKLMQLSVSKESLDINEREFNLFCKQQLQEELIS
ncbi:MAG: hypothetical protein JST81_11405 [Bacteroidetes bacterium]|nr:hypothetical protein [Bacteroidota bacterium]